MKSKVIWYLIQTVGLPTAEEFCCRFLFLGVLPMLSIFSGTTAFYVLLAASNLLFALAHLGNFEKGMRQPWRTLPHLVAGLLLSYVFLRYGYPAAVLAHLAMNFSNRWLMKESFTAVASLSVVAMLLSIDGTFLKVLAEIGLFFGAHYQGLAEMAPWPEALQAIAVVVILDKFQSLLTAAPAIRAQKDRMILQTN